MRMLWLPFITVVVQAHPSLLPEHQVVRGYSVKLQHQEYMERRTTEIEYIYTIELTSKGVGSHSPQLILSINLTQMEPIRQKTLFNCQWHRNHLINGIAVQQAMSGIVEG